MAPVRLAERAPLAAPSQTLHEYIDYSLTEVSFVLNDLSWGTTEDLQNDGHGELENEVMVDPWSSMDSSNSPLSESSPSASEESSPAAPPPAPPAPAPAPRAAPDAPRPRGLSLALQPLAPDPRRPHFLDDDYAHPTKSNIDCRIPKPHFLDHSPSPDEFDERSDITNPNFLDDDADDDQAHKKAGALPKKPQKTPSYAPQEDRPLQTSYRSTLHYGLENAARTSERDKRTSQLYRGTWPGERDVWTGHDSASVRSFSSNGSAESNRPSSNLDNKMECVCSLISLLSLSPENNADLSGPLLEMSRSVESCIAMRQAGCVPLLVQLIHSKVPRETRDRAAKALRNIIHTQTDDKAGRREARVWRLLEQVREYCYILEDIAQNKKEGKELIEDDGTKHPSQSVAALMKLSFDEEHRHVVCQLGGLQALAALVSGDQAAHGSRTDDTTCLTMRKYAGMTLTNLTFGDGNNKSLLCSFKDFMLALVEQLESPNDDMRQVTAAVLRNLSWRADSSSKQVLREVGAVKGLTKAAMTCQKEATLKSVLSALWNLTAHCSMNKVALCSVDGALGFLVDMLSYDSPTKTLAIVENAGGIMRNVSSHIAVREDYRQILRERNCLSVLLQHLKSPSLTVVSNSCGTLWNLSARCPEDQQFLWDRGAVPMLRSLIHSKHKMIAMGSGAALKNLLNSKPGKTHIVSLDTTARTLNLPALPTLVARKQKTLEQELDQNLAETCDNIEPATSPTTSNREEKNLFTATERQIAMNLERHRMTSSSPLMGALTSQISLSHSAHLASYLSCSNTLLKGALVTRSTTGSSNNVNRSESKDSVTSAQSDTVFEKVMRTGKVPVPTPRNKDLLRSEGAERLSAVSKLATQEGLQQFPAKPPVPPPRTTEMRTNYTESGYDVDQDSCDQPIDYSRKYSETKAETEPLPVEKPKSRKYKKESPTFGDYQETDLDQPTDYSLRYAELASEHGCDPAEPPGPSVHEDSIKHFATEGTPYETPIIFSTATSMSDLRIIGKDEKPKATPSVKENAELMTQSDEKDTCSIEDPPQRDNDGTLITPRNPEPLPEKRSVFDTKFSSGMISPEKPVNYCDEGTPGYFSRVSSLSSLGEPTEEDSLAKKNATAAITIEPSAQDNAGASKDKEGSRAVTFASSPGVEDTPLMFSRTSSLGSLPSAADRDHDHGSVLSEISRVTSGCISPSEIPDSPGAPASPPPEPGEEPEGRRPRSLFQETASPTGEPEVSQLDRGALTPPPLPAGALAEPLRGTQTPGDSCRVYFTEDTPAALSKATSRSDLSALSVDSTPARSQQGPLHRDNHSCRVYCTEDTPAALSKAGSRSDLSVLSVDSTSRPQGSHRDNTCRVYCTEDTPAGLSKATSRSDLSALSVDSTPALLQVGSLQRDSHSCRVYCTEDTPAGLSKATSRSDLSALSAESPPGRSSQVKLEDPPSDISSVNCDRQDVYRSLPPYLRTSTETVKMSHEHHRNLRDSVSPPPLPPKDARVAAPPRPPRAGRRHESRLPIKTQRNQDELQPVAHSANNESSSSLSLDSFGSTDREIFEETVAAGLRGAGGGGGGGAEGRAGRPRSLDRWRRERSSSLSSLSNDSFGSTDKEVFERCVRAGMSRAERRPRSGDRRPRRRRAARSQGALDRMLGEDERDRRLLEEVIARAASAKAAAAKNAAAPPAARAPAGGAAPRAPGCDRSNEALAAPPLDAASDDIDASNELRAPRLLNPAADDPDVSNESRPFDPVPDDLDVSNESRAPADDSGELDDVSPAPVSIQLFTQTVTSAARVPVADGVEFNAYPPALPDLLPNAAARASSPPDLTRRLEPSFEREATRLETSIEREAARLAARLATLTPAPPSLLELVDPPSELDRLDLETSMLSVCSIVSEVADHEKVPVTFDFNPGPSHDFLLCHSFELLDLDKVEPPSLLGELTEPLESIGPTAPAEQSDTSSVETTPKKRRDPNYLTPKEKRSIAKDRYQTYTIIDPAATSDADGSPIKRKMSAKQRRLEDRARYQTQTVDIHAIIQETKPADPEIEILKRRLAAKRTIKQKRLEDSERFRTRTLHDDIPPSPTFVTKDASFDDPGTTLQTQPYADGCGNYLPVTETPTVLDLCTLNNLKNIQMTESYRRLQSEQHQNPSSGLLVNGDGNSDSEKGQSDSDEEAPLPPKPKITIPERRDESLDSNDSQEKEELKAVRGRKKAAYVSPYRRIVPPAKKPPAVAGPSAKPVTTSKVQPTAKTTNKTPSRPSSATSSPKKTLNKSPAKTKIQTPKKAAASPVACKPLPLERQGTFTMEESSVPAKDLPVPEKKTTGNRCAKNASVKPVAVNTSPSRLPQFNRGVKPPLKKSGSGDKPATKNTKSPAIKTSASSHSLASSDGARAASATLASRGSRQGSTSSVNSVQSSKTNTKDVESKIASLWKKVEQSKKVTAKPDKRVWIEGDKPEAPKLIRSSTFEGQPKQNQVATAPKQKTTIGIRESQIPSLRPKSTPSKISAPAVKRLAPPRVFARKPANGLAA